MEEIIYLDLNYIPRYVSSSIKQFEPGENHVARYNRQDILLLVFEGELCFEEDGKEVKLCAGDYYIQTLGRWQTGNQLSHEPRYCYINFFGQYTARAERALAIRGRFDTNKMEPLCDKLCSVYKTLSLGDDGGKIFEVQTLFFDVLNSLYKENSTFTEKKCLAELIYAYLTMHFSEDITLCSLAGLFNYSKDHIIREFKRVYKITPHQYLLQCRICYAKLLLTSEPMSISDVATVCGFSDVSSFHRAFIRLEGSTPAQYKAIQNYTS